MQIRHAVAAVAAAFAAAVLFAGPAFAADGVGVVDERTGEWYLRDPATGETTRFYYGNPGDLPFVGDWDCDGVETPGLYRRSDGYVYLRNSNTQGVADVRFFFGNPGDVPLVGDFDGDGCDTVSVWRPSENRVYVIDRLGSDGRGLGAADFSFLLGNPGDVPFVGDFDGDGVDTVGLYRPGTGTAYLFDRLGPGVATRSLELGTRDDRVIALRVAGADLPVAFRPGTGTFGLPDGELQYGSARTIPIAGEFGPLPGGDEPPPPPPPYPDVGSGKRIIYSNGQQRVWLIDENERLVDTYLVSGRKGIPLLGTYRVFSKSVNARAPYGGITMKHMVRFVRPGTFGNRWSYGFHSLPRWPDGRPLQTEAELGTFRSGGCVRQADHKAEALYEWADLGTVVHVIP
ncbi:MAG TPA: hypothetical protein ENK55_11005 [Actinobacteria bacterium]|nr:hypothetical protein [Actinomycetota bacterium]